MGVRRSGHAKMANTSAGLIGGLYEIDFARVLVGAADPSPAYAAGTDGRAGAMAVQVVRGWPARARELTTLAGSQIANLLTPLAHGGSPTPSGGTGYFVVCSAPPGPSLAASLRPWSEAHLIELVLKPAALVLADLEARRLTHRAIRPGNVFQAAHGGVVTLGCAWAAPPASQQPSWIEPRYSAVCSPCGRGDGSIADDVYALGALLVMLALGRNPTEGLSDDAVLLQKLEHGSYAALAGAHRLPPAIADLARGMLADDPDHRPSPALLATPAAARARRIAARPMRHSQRPIEVGGISATTAHGVAYAISRNHAAGVAALRNSLVDRWLRRGLGDSLRAGQLEEAIRTRDAQAAAGNEQADAALIATAVAVLDPLAPLVWRSVALWPAGLGPALDHAMHHAPDQLKTLAEIALGGVAEQWHKRRADGWASALGNLTTRELRALQNDKRADVTPWRLCYALNPLTPCASPLLARLWVTRLGELVPAMESAAAAQPPGGQILLDGQITAFIAARRDERLQDDIGHLASDFAVEDVHAQVRLVARLQARFHPQPLPALSAWAVEVLQPLINQFSSRSRRTRLAAEIAGLASAGQLTPMVSILDDTADRAADKAGHEAASARILDIEQTLQTLTAAEPGRMHRAKRVAYDAAGGLGAIACLVALAAVLLW